MENLKELPMKFNTYKEFKDCISDNTMEQAIEFVDRGDWILRIAKEIGLDMALRTLAKGKCSETVLPHMKDQRSKDAVKAAIDFGNGLISHKELIIFCNAAFDAIYETTDVKDIYVAYSAAEAAHAYEHDNNDFSGIDSAADAANFYDYNNFDLKNARKENQLKTAKICRNILGHAIIERVDLLLTYKPTN